MGEGRGVDRKREGKVREEWGLLKERARHDLDRPGLGFWLCDLGQFTQHLCASFPVSTKWG